jgi:hypothetical protein
VHAAQYDVYEESKREKSPIDSLPNLWGLSQERNASLARDSRALILTAIGVWQLQTSSQILKLLFPPVVFAISSISIRDRDCTTCQEHHRHNYYDVKVLLFSQCASCMFLHRPWRLLNNDSAVGPFGVQLGRPPYLESIEIATRLNVT